MFWDQRRLTFRGVPGRRFGGWLSLVEAVGSVVMALVDAMVERVQPQPHVEPNVGISIKLRAVGG
jgi:hypothetical protein